MIATALVAVVLIGAVSARQRLWWSWRAVVQPASWKRISALAALLLKQEQESRLASESWRVSRRRIADEYNAEAARLRRLQTPSDDKRAAEYENYARDVLERLAAQPWPATSLDESRRAFFATHGKLDTIDAALLILLCSFVFFLCLIVPLGKARGWKRVIDGPAIPEPLACA